MIKNNFWQKIVKYKIFIILGGIILVFLFLKLNLNKKNNNEVINSDNGNKISNVIYSENNNFEIKNEVTVSPTNTKEQIEEKKMTQEEISNLNYEDYFKYIDTLSDEEQKNSPPLAAMVNESFPYEKETFRAERFENLKVYAKAKIDDKAKTERDLKYWFYIEVGSTLPSEKIVWQ